jgi:hypothetical protein
MDWDHARDDVEERLRKISVALPEPHEGPAWTGRSWLIRKNHFRRSSPWTTGRRGMGS